MPRSLPVVAPRPPSPIPIVALTLAGLVTVAVGGVQLASVLGQQVPTAMTVAAAGQLQPGQWVTLTDARVDLDRTVKTYPAGRPSGASPTSVPRRYYAPVQTGGAEGRVAVLAVLSPVQNDRADGVAGAAQPAGGEAVTGLVVAGTDTDPTILAILQANLKLADGWVLVDTALRPDPTGAIVWLVVGGLLLAGAGAVLIRRRRGGTPLPPSRPGLGRTGGPGPA